MTRRVEAFEYSFEDIKQSHRALVKALLEGYKEIRLDSRNLTGFAIDISTRDIAGSAVLKILGAKLMGAFHLSVDKDLPRDLQDIMQKENQQFLIERLKLVPDQSVALVTVFDHSDRLIGTQAGREIERILIPGGQRIITVESMDDSPRQDEFVKPSRGSNGKFVTHAIEYASLPDLGSAWYDTERKFAPNNFVSLYTKPQTT